MSELAAPSPAPEPSPRGLGVSRLLSDDQLARRAAKGDRRAFAVIFDRYHQDLYRFCLAMVGNPQDAQDALQETMVKVLRALPGEKRHIQLRPWLYRIAHNEAIETVRRRRDSVDIDSQERPSTVEVAETAEARERLRRLIVDLEQLPERQRAALVMRELAGLPFAQIGEAFDTSAAVARQTVYEARLSLRQMDAGREMSCAEVTRELSDRDGRITRRRELRAHLRSCPSCRAFQESIAERHRNLAAIAPLPIALSAGLLHGILTGKASAAVGTGSAAGAGSGIAGTVGAGAGKAIATSAIVKSAATLAVVAAVGVSAADRAGLIHVPLPGDAGRTTKTMAPPATPPSGSAGRSEAQGQGAAPTPAAGTDGGHATRGRNAHRRRSAVAADRHSHAGGRSAQGRAHSHRHYPSQARTGHQRHPGTPPPAASHGREVAGSHRPPQASETSRAGAGSGGSGSRPASPPSSPPAAKGEAPVTPPATPPTEAPATGRANGSLHGPGSETLEP